MLVSKIVHIAAFSTRALGSTEHLWKSLSIYIRMCESLMV